jgi:hypothetical protein
LILSGKKHKSKLVIHKMTGNDARARVILEMGDSILIETSVRGAHKDGGEI